MNRIKVSVTEEAVAYAREHLWGNHPGDVRGMVQDQSTGASYALIKATASGVYFAGLDGQMARPLNKGTIEARIALAEIGAKGGKAGKGVARPGVSEANRRRWREQKGGAE
jgi:hypothetical protein